jgi:GxxExxY protein
MEERVEAASKAVIGAAIEVHKRLGPGYLESVYEQALLVELRLRRVPFQSQVSFVLDYKGHPVGAGRVDLIVDECVIVELKATEGIDPIHLAQVISYLKATQLRIGLIINFNVRKLTDGLKRIAL